MLCNACKPPFPYVLSIFDELGPHRIGAAVLSHRVDTFTLVAAFFLFSIGCLDILVGLIWRESARAKRSLTSWREQAKSVLPTHVAGVDVQPAMSKATSTASSVVSSLFTGKDQSSSKAGFGFGRQGEKVAGLNGRLSWRLFHSDDD